MYQKPTQRRFREFTKFSCNNVAIMTEFSQVGLRVTWLVSNMVSSFHCCPHLCPALTVTDMLHIVIVVLNLFFLFFILGCHLYKN